MKVACTVLEGKAGVTPQTYLDRSRTFKWINMALKIKTREEAIAVLRDMVKRKREMEAKAQIDFAKARKEAANCYAGL